MLRKACGQHDLLAGLSLVGAFALWTMLVCCVDVRPVGQAGTDVGLATINVWFHGLTGVHMGLYVLTDWLGLVPIAVCLGFGALGVAQLVARRSFARLDVDLILLGVHYVIVIACYLLFETIVINYRPIPIDGIMEASYPSSTTLLVLSVMPTLCYQVRHRVESMRLRRAVSVSVAAFSALMVVGRLVSGVHWVSDIVGAVLLASGLFWMYRWAVGYVERMGADARAKG